MRAPPGKAKQGFLGRGLAELCWSTIEPDNVDQEATSPTDPTKARRLRLPGLARSKGHVVVGVRIIIEVVVEARAPGAEIPSGAATAEVARRLIGLLVAGLVA